MEVLIPLQTTMEVLVVRAGVLWAALEFRSIPTAAAAVRRQVAPLATILASAQMVRALFGRAALAIGEAEAEAITEAEAESRAVAEAVTPFQSAPSSPTSRETADVLATDFSQSPLSALLQTAAPCADFTAHSQVRAVLAAAGVRARRRTTRVAAGQELHAGLWAELCV